jgi:hypothetical protein
VLAVVVEFDLQMCGSGIRAECGPAGRLTAFIKKRASPIQGNEFRWEMQFGKKVITSFPRLAYQPRGKVALEITIT